MRFFLLPSFREFIWVWAQTISFCFFLSIAIQYGTVELLEQINCMEHLLERNIFWVMNPVKRHKVIFDENPGSFDENPRVRSSIGTSPKRMEYHPRNSNAKRCSVFLRGSRVTRKWNRTSRLVFLTPSRKTRWKTTDTFSVAWTPVQMGSITPHRLQIPSLLSTESIQIVYMNTFFVVSLHSFHPSQRNGAHHPRLWTVVLSFCRQMPRHRQSFCFFVSERVLHTWFTDNSTNAQTICIDWSWFGYLLHALAEKLTICEPWWIGANFGVAEIFHAYSVPRDIPCGLFLLFRPRYDTSKIWCVSRIGVLNRFVRVLIENDFWENLSS